MRFFFIRHGQSVNNALWDRTGSDKGRSIDPELTGMGHEQAKRLAEFILQKDAQARADGRNGEPRRDFFGFTHIYTSLMVRSVATGTYIADALGLPLIAWPEIHECGGIYEDRENERIGLPGYQRSYYQQNFNGLVLPDSLTEDGWWNRPFESREDRPLRAQQVLQMLMERHGSTNDRVAIVSHGGFYMEFTRVLWQLERQDSWFLMWNTAVSRFDFRPNGEAVLVYHNCTDHLPEQMIT